LAAADAAVDEWSDLDVRLYVVDAEQLLRRRAWFEQFGDVLVVEALANPGWHPTRLVHCVDAKIVFMIAPTAALEGRKRFGRAVSVLVDKDGLTEGIGQGEPARVSLPDEAEFLTCVNEFYAPALRHARMLVRDEPIKAKVRDWDMKTCLFTMIAWDHVARFGDDRDVRPFGTAFPRWADRDLVRELDRCWSGLDLDAAQQASAATIALFRTSADRVAVAAGLAAFDATAVLQEIERILSARR
jgi:aminoglycoside 6-adenylyltransferase